MKRTLAAVLLATFTLVAQDQEMQVWEGSSVVTVPGFFSMLSAGSDPTALKRWDARGRLQATLLPPPSSRYIRQTYWNGQALVFGFQDHPAWHFPDLGRRAWSFPNRSLNEAYQKARQHLWISRDFRTWSVLATYQADDHSRLGPSTYHALQDGSLLVLGRTLFWDGNRVSPLARYRIDARKNLVFERLVDLAPEGPWRVVRSPAQAKPRTELLPGYEDLNRDGWLWARSPAGLLLLHHRGRGFLLDNHTGLVLRAFRLPAVDPGAREVVALQPGPEGAFRVASLESSLGDGIQRMRLFQPAPDASPTQRHATALLATKTPPGLGDLIPAYGLPLPLVWHLVDPRSGEIHPLPPPPGAPKHIEDRKVGSGFGFRVQADGSVKVLPWPRHRSGMPW